MAWIQHKAVITYSDCWNNRAELTQEELTWFYAMVDLAKAATGCTLDIIPRDGDEDEQGDALGYICTTDIKNRANPAKANTFIAIDTYYIDEEWRHEFKGAFTLEKERLLRVMAHEIAHLTYWRHGAKHEELTERLYQQILNYQQEVAA